MPLLATDAVEVVPNVQPDHLRAIAKEAYVYGFPVVDSYRIQHAYFIDSKSPQYKVPFNRIGSFARVFTPQDTVVQTPNSDTPYSFIGLDLRAEPIVLTVPKIEKTRYFSIQLIDAYTFNFDYIGSRRTGNDGGSYLIAGPCWKGEAPKGIAKVLRSETDLVLGLYRTQLFNAQDIENVKQIQAGYKAQPLSSFLGTVAPPAPPAVEFPIPLSPEGEKSSLEFFNLLSFVLQFCPTHPSEVELMARFAEIGVGAGKRMDFEALKPELKQAFAAGMADAWMELAEFEKTAVITGKVSSGDVFGNREFLKNNYLYRFAAAVLGIFGNSKEEAMYPIYQADSDGDKLDGSKHQYSLRFAKDQLPPVNAFWSLTMYRLPESLLVENPINRYLLNSPMLPSMRSDPDGGLTLYVQYASPGKEKESNWLPAPNGPFTTILRLYWPKPEALDGRWAIPLLKKAQ